MGVHLITGYKGEEHIQSKDVRSFNAAMFGGGEFVMEIGNQLEGSIINNNTVRILDGDILMQGGHIRIETDTYEDLTITTGTAGKNRIDLIVMTYEKNNSDGTEDAYLEVIKGTESAGTASDPEYISGVISEGALKNQMPLYRVKIEGVVLSEIESLFTTIPTYKKLAEQAAAQYKATINALKSAEILDTMEEIEANTQGNLFAGALALKEGYNALNSNLNELKTVVSNTERAIGTLDGSILYEKVYTVNTMSANTNVTLDTDFTIDSYARLVEVTGTVTRSNGTAFQLPYFWSTSDHINIEVSSRGLLLSNISEVACITATVIVRYTKP